MTNRTMRAFVVLVALAAAPAACKVDQPCDSRSYYDNRTCRPLPPDAGDAPEGGARADAVAPDVVAEFGATCTEHGQCGGPTNACLVQPGATMGFCSYVECDKRPGVCPAMWSCCDLSRFQPGAPFGCIPLPGCP